MISPLFKRIWEPEERQHLKPLRVTRSMEPVFDPISGETKISSRIGVCSQEESNWTIPVHDVEDAEMKLLSRATAFGLFEDHPLAIQVNRAASHIAAATRRGAGNVIMIHPDGIKKFAEGISYPPITPRIKLVFGKGMEPPGRWFHAGVFNRHSNLYTCPGLPHNRVFVAYMGGTCLDQPGYLAYRDDGSLELVLLEQKEGFLGSCDDYIRVIEY